VCFKSLSNYKKLLNLSLTVSKSKERIETLKGGVKQAKDATKPSGKERTLLKQNEILTAGNLEKLKKKSKN
jgi:hypothetical protein